jgi:hypothetical protein
MLRKTFALAVLALAIPAVALAAKPTTHTSQSKAAPKVMYILKGKLSNFTAASSTTTGSITIDVKHSNYHARALVGQSLTFAVSADTATNATTINDGTRGIVKFRAVKNQTNSTLMASLTASTPMTAFQVIAR